MASNVIWIDNNGNLDGVEGNKGPFIVHSSNTFNVPKTIKQHEFDKPEYEYLDRPDCDTDDEVDVITSGFNKLK